MNLPTTSFDMNRYQYQQNYPDSPTALNESFGSSGSSSTLSFESADLNLENSLVGVQVRVERVLKKFCFEIIFNPENSGPSN